MATMSAPVGIDATLELTEEHEGQPSTVFTNEFGEQFRLSLRSDVGQTPTLRLTRLYRPRELPESHVG